MCYFFIIAFFLDRVSIVNLKKSTMKQTILLIENPIKSPSVPPTDPKSVVPSVMRYSLYTFAFKGIANL